MRVAAWLLLLCTSAAAQDTPAFSPEATRACLDGDGGIACVGKSAGLCIDTPGGYTTVGMGYCLGQEWQWWDARLNAAYTELRTADLAEDAEMKDLGATVPEKGPALRDMQRAWISYRDALCDYERAQWGGGTGQGPATAQCLMHETARQTLVLERRLAEYRGR